MTLPLVHNAMRTHLDAGRSRGLRIALVTEYYYPHLGGVCEHVHFFAREARKLGHHVDIITSEIAGAPDIPGVIRIGRSQPIFINGSMSRITIGIDLRRQMRKTLRRGKYDIVHVHSPLTPVLPILAIDEADCPVVGTFHTYFHRSVGYAIARRYFQRRLERLDRAIAVSVSTVGALERYFDADWTVIPNGVDTTQFHPDAPRPHGLPSDKPTILFLGRMDPRNGLGLLLHTFRRIRGRGREAQLVVVGDGPLRRYYEHEARNHPDIHFVGSALAERAGYYANSDVYACPTSIASFGITLLESMACATPIACSNIPGFRDVVAHNREAIMVSHREPGVLADALVELLDDETLRARLGHAGRQRSLHYDWSHVTRRVLDEYASVLGLAAAAA